MRARRSAKFAEYLATYTILEHIGIHPTALIEKRDAAVGVGVYVRDACDAGTTLLAVPSRRFCTPSVLSKVGLKCRYTDPWSIAQQQQKQKPPEKEKWDAATTSAVASSSPSGSATAPAVDVKDGLVTFLTGSAQWPEVAWRLAMEQQRSVSHLWGWLQSLPSAEELKDQADAAERRCRVHHTMLLPYYLKGRQRMQEETAAAYQQMRSSNLLPSYALFCWAVDVLMTRGLLLPLAWPSTTQGTQSCPAGNGITHSSQDGGCTDVMEHSVDMSAIDAEASLELGVAPFIDLVNAADNAGRVANAHIEVASSLEELPTFFKEEMAVQSAARGRDGLMELETLLHTHYYLCLTLLTPLRASEEVIVDWDTPVLTTGVLQPAEDQLVSRLLKYKF